MRIPRLAAALLLPVAAAAHPAAPGPWRDRPQPGPELRVEPRIGVFDGRAGAGGAAPPRPSPIIPESVGALCYHRGLAYSEGAMLAARLPDPNAVGAEGGAILRDVILHCRRESGVLRWAVYR